MPSKPVNLLVVDWDQFFPNPWGSPNDADIRRQDILLYDWGHRESQFFIHGIWSARSHGFLMNDVPLPGLNGVEKTFWDRFTFAPKTDLFYAESNASAVHMPGSRRSRRTFESVWLYDAHHDSGYHESPTWQELVEAGVWQCENWMCLYAALGARLHMRYPTWRAWAMDGEPEPLVHVDRQVDDDQPNPTVFNRIFVCRSGAWVPPWLDMDLAFQAFIDRAPVKRKIRLDEGGLPPREWDSEGFEADARTLRLMIANAR